MNILVDFLISPDLDLILNLLNSVENEFVDEFDLGFHENLSRRVFY